ncbi:MAG: hypothetical protein DKT66_26275 [Candidatus Melainabacteria bacterium]|nr:MAG: hypothetical protein DKT66_26275 [Candidatus Melainabacteria bacterium]
MRLRLQIGKTPLQMLKLPKLLIPFIATFYTVCSQTSALGDDSTSVSTSVFHKIESSSPQNLEDSVDLVFDYIFALKEENKSPTELIKAILPLCKKDESNRVYRLGPVLAQHWLVALNDFSVDAPESMTLLNRALATIVDYPPHILSPDSVQTLLRFAKEIEELKTPNDELQKTRVSTLRQLVIMARANKECSQKIGTLALEQIAAIDSTAVKESEWRDVISQVIGSYTSEYPRSKNNGDLLFRDAIAIAAIAARTNNKYLQLHYLYNELFRRCTNVEALEAQLTLVDAAKQLKIDDNTLHKMFVQLACAYLRAGKPQQAEEVLTKQIQAQNPIDVLLLVECLRKQGKFSYADKLCQKLATSKLSFQIMYPSSFVAMANAVRAEILIEQKNYQVALPLLISADSWFSNAVSHENRNVQELIFMDDLVPNEISVLSNLALTYEKLGRKSDVQRIKLTLSEVKKQSKLAILFVERDFLVSDAKAGIDSETSQNQARRMVEILEFIETDLSKREKLILDYAESLVRHGKSKSAIACIEAAEKSGIIKNSTKMGTRFRALRIFIAEEREDLTGASQLLKDLPSANGQSLSDDSLRIAELEARLALLTRDYPLAETKSRPLEVAIDSSSKFHPNGHQDSKRDQFVSEHSEAILDRVLTLNQLHDYKGAARLARLLLLIPNQYDRTGASSAANLALAYANDGHKGLADAALHEAQFKDRGSFPFAPSRYEIDAKEKLAVLSEMKDNPLRARRYRAEAEEVREQLDRNNTRQSAH